MSDEYISRETLRDLMYTEAFERDTGLQRWDSGLWIRFKLFENCLDAIPAADVVEVVRCYECKYWEHRPDRQYDLCAYLFGAKRSCNPEDFCSRGERKGGQEEIPAGPYDLLYEEGGPDA